MADTTVINIPLPKDAEERIIHALSVAGGKEDDSLDCARQTVIEFIQQTVRNVEISEAARAQPTPEISTIELA